MINSATKQSILSWRGPMDCSASARNDGLHFADRMKLLNQFNGQITSDFQKWCQAPFAKIFRFAPDPNQFTDSHRPVPTRGALRTSPTWDGMRWTLAARETSAACWRTAKSCGSDAPMPASSLREDAQATVSTKHGHRGEHEVSRKNIARGMPGRSGVTVVTMLVYFFICTRGCGCIARPAFPAPSDFSGAGRFCKTSDASRREIAESYPHLPSLRAKRSNPSRRAKGRMDCFVASLLAMTVSERIPLAMTVSRRAPPPQPSSPAKAGDPVFQRRL